MHRQQQDVLLLGEAEQGGAQERSLGEVEGTGSLLGRESLRLGLRAFVPGEVHAGQRERSGRGDALDGDTVLLMEGSAQGFVAAEELGEGSLEGADIQRSVAV